MLRVHSGGSLSLVPGGVVSSRGGLPDSLAVHGDLVYVANSGAGHSNYTGFRLGFGGHLSRIPGSTVTLASGAAPGDVLFDGTGTRLVGTEVGPSVIDSFTVSYGGRLTAAPGSPFPARAWGRSAASSARPTRTSCSCPTPTTPPPTAAPSRRSKTRNGRLSSIAGSPFPDHQMAPCWVEITRDGQFLFTVNTASGTISGYRIAANGALSLLPGSTPAGGPNAGAVDARLSPDGGFLYVDQSKTGAVAAFAVNGGGLTQLGASPFSLPAGAAPAGIVVGFLHSLVNQAGAARPTRLRPDVQGQACLDGVAAQPVKLNPASTLVGRSQNYELAGYAVALSELLGPAWAPYTARRSSSRCGGVRQDPSTARLHLAPARRRMAVPPGPCTA